MIVESMVLAEGIAQDARGAYTLVGVGQNVVITDVLPAQTRRAVLAQLVEVNDEGSVQLRSASFTFSVMSPSGEVLAATSGQIGEAGKRFADLPLAAAILADFVFSVAEYGRHQIRFHIRFGDGATAHAETWIDARATADANPS